MSLPQGLIIGNPSLLDIAFFFFDEGIGIENPLLDISGHVSQAFLDKYGAFPFRHLINP